MARPRCKAVPALRRGRCVGPLDGVLGLGCFNAKGLDNPYLFGCVLPAAATLQGRAEGGRQGRAAWAGDGEVGLGVVRFQEGPA